MRRPIAPWRAIALTAVASVTIATAEAQDPGRVRSAVEAYRKAHDHEILRELSEFLAIPNLARDSVNIRRNARHLVQMLERRGIAARLLETSGAPPAVFGELRVPGATRTVVFYAHYDGQPVNPAQWATPPWSPTLRNGLLDSGAAAIPLPTRSGRLNGEWRLYARSAGDDKSPIVAFLSALDALRSAGIEPSVNLKFYFEGEEEAGSSHLREALTMHRDALAADLWIFGDGPVHQSRRQLVSFGVRGVMGVEITVYGPARTLHSGHYGNWAPNPLAMLTHLIASMRDPNGRILIAGFHDDVRPPTSAERGAIAAAPQPDSALRQELLLHSTESNDALLMERIMLPALNVRGLGGGSGANAIPTQAFASIDFRLVPEQKPGRVRDLVESHARMQGFYVVHAEPTPQERLAHPRVAQFDWEEGYPASRADMSSPAAIAVIRAVERGLGERPIAVPTMGGSLPLYQFTEVLGAPLVTVPIVNHDNNQHASNENLRLQNLFDGMQVYAGLAAHLGSLWPSDSTRP